MEQLDGDGSQHGAAEQDQRTARSRGDTLATADTLTGGACAGGHQGLSTVTRRLVVSIAQCVGLVRPDLDDRWLATFSARCSAASWSRTARWTEMTTMRRVDRQAGGFGLGLNPYDPPAGAHVRTHRVTSGSPSAMVIDPARATRSSSAEQRCPLRPNSAYESSKNGGWARKTELGPVIGRRRRISRWWGSRSSVRRRTR